MVDVLGILPSQNKRAEEYLGRDELWLVLDLALLTNWWQLHKQTTRGSGNLLVNMLKILISGCFLPLFMLSLKTTDSWISTFSQIDNSDSFRDQKKIGLSSLIGTWYWWDLFCPYVMIYRYSYNLTHPSIYKTWHRESILNRILYLVKLSFKSEREIKTFLDKQKMREFVTPRHALQEMPKGVLHVAMKEK